MDIAVPKPDADAPQKVAVTVATGTPSVPKRPETDQPAIKSADTPTAADERNKVIAELINSKKYSLNIKEKRTVPLLTLGFTRPSVRKGRKNVKKLQKQTSKKTTTKKVESSKAKTVKLVLIGLLGIGAYLALDMGLIDIGWRPPFTIIGPL